MRVPVRCGSGGWAGVSWVVRSGAGCAVKNIRRGRGRARCDRIEWPVVCLAGERGALTWTYWDVCFLPMRTVCVVPRVNTGNDRASRSHTMFILATSASTSAVKAGKKTQRHRVWSDNVKKDVLGCEVLSSRTVRLGWSIVIWSPDPQDRFQGNNSSCLLKFWSRSLTILSCSPFLVCEIV